MAIAGSSRRAQIELGLDPKGMDTGIREARAKLRGFEDRLGKGIRRKGGAMATGIIGGLVGGVTGAVTGRVLGMVENTAEDVLNVERALTRLQIASGQSATELAKVRQNLNHVSRASGISRSEILSGSSTYLALTGDVAGATQSMALFAKVANASGSGMADIASTAASMKDNLKIDPKDFEKGFDILISQGKEGAIELNELATLLAGLAPSFAQFEGGSGIDGMADLGASFQAARKGFGSAAEAATGVRALMVSINRSADKFQKAGVKIFTKNPKTGKKELRGFLDIVDAIGRSKLARDPTALTKAFGSDEAKRVFDQLILNRDLVRELQENRGGGAVSKDSATYLASTAGKVETAMNAAKLALVEAFSPQRIEKFVAALGKAAEVFAEIVGYVDRIMTERPEKDAMQEERQRRIQDEFERTGASRADLAQKYGLALPDTVGAFDVARNVAQRGQGIPTGMFEVLAAAVKQGVLDAQRSAPRGAERPLAVTVQLGTESVNQVAQNAKAHRGRPGGR